MAKRKQPEKRVTYDSELLLAEDDLTELVAKMLGVAGWRVQGIVYECSCGCTNPELSGKVPPTLVARVSTEVRRDNTGTCDDKLA